MPEIAAILRNTVTTGNTLEDREEKLNGCSTTSPAFSDTTRDFLDENGDNMIRVSQLGRPAAAGAREVLPGVPLPAPAAS